MIKYILYVNLGEAEYRIYASYIKSFISVREEQKNRPSAGKTHITTPKQT